MQWPRVFFSLAVILYLSSLFLPAAAFYASYGPDSNPKAECVMAERSDVVCDLFDFGQPDKLTSCNTKWQRSLWGLKWSPVDKNSILAYCADWRSAGPPHFVYKRGIYFLVLGWLGIFAGGIYAWYANLTGFFGFVGTIAQFHRAGFVLWLLSFLIGLNAYQFLIIEDPGSGAKLYIDHYTAGFYFWEGSFLLMLVFCGIKIWDAHKAKKPKP